MGRHGIQSYHSPPPAQPSSPEDSVISDHDLDSLKDEEEGDIKSGLRDEIVLKGHTSPNGIALKDSILKSTEVIESDSSHDSDSDLLDMARIATQPASLPSTPIISVHSPLPSGFYGSRGTVSPIAASQDLVDLSALGIPFSPSEVLGVVPPSIAKMTPPDNSESPRIVTEKEGIATEKEGIATEKEEIVPEGFINPKVVRRSRQMRMEKGIGYRSIPPFRRRVVFLPPLPIATCKSLEKPQEGKQVRFFTNVICHEYRSY